MMTKYERKQLRSMLRPILKMVDDKKIEKELRLALWFVQDCKQQPSEDSPPVLGVAVSDSVGVDDKFGRK